MERRGEGVMERRGRIEGMMWRGGVEGTVRRGRG